MVVFGQKRLYSQIYGCFWENGLYLGKIVVFGQKWLYSDKVVVFLQNYLLSRRSCCIWAKGVVFG